MGSHRPPYKQNSITAKWLFKLKRNPKGEINKFKARVVARGFQQREGIDYQDIFASVVRWSRILLILAMATRQNWTLHQMDVITAFLNGDINEEILMEIPEGLPGSDDPTKVCRIKKALYGLKQSPKAWYNCIDGWLREQGMIRSESDQNLYFMRREGKLTLLLLYVDDLLITADDQEQIAHLKRALHNDFEMTLRRGKQLSWRRDQSSHQRHIYQSSRIHTKTLD